jgi:Lipase (class 3)
MLPVPTYNPQQIIFTLSTFSNLGSCMTGSVEDIETKLTQTIRSQLTDPQTQTQIGSWDLVWGPAVYKFPTSTLPDNVMYVAKSNGQLVVAIAGTTPCAFLDWLIEDFFVYTQVPWPTSPPAAGCKISLGIFIGLSILQTLKPGKGQPGAGVRLKDFLATQSSSPISITLTGHSLGGALSPTLALWLHDTQTEWDPAGNASLSVLASAGPTPGNGAFASYLDTKIGPQVTRLYNPLDVVPKAWTTSDLQTIPNLYQPEIQPVKEVNDLVQLAIYLSSKGDYTQIKLGTPPLSGSAFNPSASQSGHSDFMKFILQAGYQHTLAYHSLLGLPTPPASGLNCSLCKEGIAAPENVLSRIESKLAKFRA